MSYDIRLVDMDGQTIILEKPHRLCGGTYSLGGTHEAWLNVTYNYSKFFHETIDKDQGIRWLYGKKAADCIPVLEAAVGKLGTSRSDDYWDSTPGNAGAALANLLELAKICPNGIFAGD